MLTETSVAPAGGEASATLATSLLCSRLDPGNTRSGRQLEATRDTLNGRACAVLLLAGLNPGKAAQAAHVLCERVFIVQEHYTSMLGHGS